MFSIFIGSAWLALIAYYFFLLYRNERVYAVRMAFIDAGGCHDGSLAALPKYDAMLEHPKYFLLWTEADWRAWIARQSKEITR